MTSREGWVHGIKGEEGRVGSSPGGGAGREDQPQALLQEEQMTEGTRGHSGH